MNDAFLPSILTILFQLVIIGIYFLHNSHFFRYFIPQALRNDEPQQSCKLEDLSGIVTQSASRGFDDPFYLPTHADNFNICSKFTSCHELAFEDLSRNVSTIFMDYKEDKFPTAFSIVDRNYSWEAFNWNLWNFTQFRWPLLHNVLEVERSILANGNALGVFLVSEENSVNEPVNETEPALPALTSSQSLFPEEFSPYTINQEMFFWDFLYDILPNKTFSTENLPKDHCRYYSTNYRVFESFTGSENDTTWRQFQIIEKLKGFNKSEIRRIAPMLNLLYPNCALQFRYSEYNTVKIQLQGKAEYLLVPIQSSRFLFPFPYGYPFRRQSQINIYKNKKNFQSSLIEQSMKNISQVYSVTLQKGEALIIPPGYFMYTEAHTLSMTLDIVSPSVEQMILLEALSAPIPCLLEKGKILGKDQGSHAKEKLQFNETIVCTQVYLVHILSRLYGITDIQKYSRNLYLSRYELLYSKDSLFIQKNLKDFKCYKNQQEFYDNFIQSLDRELIESFADNIAKKLNSSKLHPSLKWFWVGNFIDAILKKVYGEGSYGQIALFILECLNIPGKIEVIEEVEGPNVMKVSSDEPEKPDRTK